ncbi:NEDD8-activating enzyme E1 regulatory subunit [Borealophlyctis nickersoniae]|nr:NEDD8-activating enzyme E1 regulatory subunit [Borealophlyctis nickersoniae]
MDKKTQKYDRQLRLWHAHGQAALEQAKVCLLNGSAVGTETLKNLILPGIGSFTVVDGKPVAGSDVGNNFFLTVDCIGQSRAKCVTEMLRELNEEVAGYHVEEDPVDLVENKPDFFLQYSIIIATQLPESALLKLADICWDANIPLVVVRTYGFLAYARIVVPEHTIIETHPEQLLDLRFDVPFPALLEFAQSFDFEKTDSMAFSHIPYVVILLRCLEAWKKRHDGKLPSNRDERNQYKQSIRAMQRNDLPDAENFDEAYAAAHRAWTETKVPSPIRQMLDDAKADAITPKTPNFWIIARAVRDFVANEGRGLLPLAGAVPDMKSDTESYVKLQTLYRTKAREDCNLVRNRVTSLLASIDKPADAITTDEIERFCKFSSHLKVIRYRSLREEYTLNTARSHNIGQWLQDLDSEIIYYVLLRAVDAFYETHKRYPGFHNEEVETDIGLLKKCVTALLAEWQITSATVSDDHIHEMVRAGASEIHTVAALHGGVVSQEIIKLITSQYVPMDNTVVFNTIKSTSSVFVL